MLVSKFGHIAKYTVEHMKAESEQVHVSKASKNILRIKGQRLDFPVQNFHAVFVSNLSLTCCS